MNLVVHTDGGARGNPGPAAIGVLIEEEENISSKNIYTKIAEIERTIGETTNNVAEYAAVYEALNYIKNLNRGKSYQQILFFIDSILIVQQLNGIFKIKNSNLREMLMKIRLLESEINIPVSYFHIPREENINADLLVNHALDNQQ